MKIKNIEIFHVDAGWRPWTFIKISTDEDLCGWSECTDSNGSPFGMEGVIKDLAPLLNDQDPSEILKLIELMYSRTRQSSSGIVHKVIGGIENALWDLKGKSLGTPVYELFGGPIRTEIETYWSHCGTTRVRASEIANVQKISEETDFDVLAREIDKLGFHAVKTNIGIFDPKPHIYMPGFGRTPGGPELNLDNKLKRSITGWVANFRNAVGDHIDIALDLNFNFKTEGYKAISKSLDEFNLSWLEIDSYDPLALAEIKQCSYQPIASCENLYGLREYRPFFDKRSMDIAIIDVIWNGMTKSRSIAELANSHEINVCTHNYNGYLSTAISSHFASVTPNLKMAEIDVDDVPWRDDIFTNPPEIVNGKVLLSNEPGWGTEPIEKQLKKYPWPK